LHERILRASGLAVSAIGLGCMGMSYHRSTAMDRGAAIALIREAVELGVTMLDTAQVYGPFTNEELMGGRSPHCGDWESRRSTFSTSIGSIPTCRSTRSPARSRT
jgi:aryl-alcohol dehydrogenase-like predicted oxidoreductase